MVGPIAVLGAGSWGTALALHLAQNGNDVLLWGHDPQHVQALLKQKENKRYIPGFPFPDTLTATSSLYEALTVAKDVLLAIPSHAFRDAIEKIKEIDASRPWRLVWVTKGLDPMSGDFFHAMIRRALPDARLAVLSGPSFALEVARRIPTAVTLAVDDPQWEQDLIQRFHGPSFRLYTTDDFVGVQLGGVLKNIIAIGVGIADGLGNGANTRCALIARGLSEMRRLGAAMGAKSETFMGLSGLGDLVLSCTDDQSRNRRFGLMVGQGISINDAISNIGQVVEGIKNARVIASLAEQHHVDMPICEQVNAILENRITPYEAVGALILRSQKKEA
jgi:glycerol-3-phosphate dehydrogenase (NAD(P)+)